MATKFIGNVPVNEDAVVGSLPSQIQIPATAQGTGTEIVIGQYNSPNPPTLKSITLIPQANVATSGTDYMTVSLKNRTTGAGNITLATVNTSAAGLTAYTSKSLTPDYTQAAVNKGDVLTLVVAKTGAGVATPPMLAILDWQY